MPDSGTMPASDSQESADLLLQLALPRSQKVVLVIDLVESVRLMSADEAGTVARWHGFVQQAKDHTIPQHHGRLVKSLGDGLMVEFEQARDAVNAAQTLHSAITHTNAGQSADRHMHLRAGINSSQIYTDQLDIYGAGVNLAARLATLAGPGETVVSASVRDGLTDGLDASVEDLGECYLKHIDEPVRAYRAGVAGPHPYLVREGDYSPQLQPIIAVIPFASRSTEQEQFAVGELIADGVIGLLSKTRELKVVSRLSTTAFRGRESSVSTIQKQLGANYVVSGSYSEIGSAGGTLLINTELADTNTGQVIWADRICGEVGDLLQERSEIIYQIATSILTAVLDSEIRDVSIQPPATLKSYALLLGGISLMHRSLNSDFEQGRSVLDHLIERHSRSSMARAWRAKWHVLRATRGVSTDLEAEASQALDQTRRALDMEPNNALALAMEGFVYCHLKQDLSIAQERLSQAIDADPCNSSAWLFMSTVQSLLGQTGKAYSSAQQAISLSPIDPLKYYYFCLAGHAALFDERREEAVALMTKSWQLNRFHAPTARMLAVAHSELGQHDLAKNFLTHLMRLEPTLTAQRYLARSPGGLQYRERFAQALVDIGLPKQ